MTVLIPPSISVVQVWCPHLDGCWWVCCSVATTYLEDLFLSTSVISAPKPVYTISVGKHLFIIWVHL